MKKDTSTLESQKKMWMKLLDECDGFVIITKDKSHLKAGINTTTKQSLAEFSLYLRKLAKVTEELYLAEGKEAEVSSNKANYIG